MNFVYILECKDGTLYTGWTTDLQKRIKQHNSGEGAKYTRARLPVELKYFEKCDSREEALQREYFIKKLSRQKKLELINSLTLE